MNLQTGCGISPSPPRGEIGKESRKWRLARRLVLIRINRIWSIMGWPRRSVNMPSLYEIFNNAHDGEGMTTLGREFGLTQTQTEAAVTALLPAISTGLKQSTATVDGLGNLFGVMGQQQNLQALYDDPETAFGPEGVAAGNDALSVIFGSPDVSRAVTDQAQKFSGVDSSVLKKL